MHNVDALAQLIPVRRLADVTADGGRIGVSTIASLLQTVRGNGDTSIHCAVAETLVRLAETHVLSHPKIARLVEVWDSIVGTAEERIQGHLADILRRPPHPSLVSHVYRCISGAAAQRGRQKANHDHFFLDILERLAASSGEGRELRCEGCGYHFRVKDISNDRVRSALDLDLRFAKSLFPGRSSDPYKPIDRGNSDTFTRLTVDHIIPEETFGWTELDNLEILCSFCNLGKMAYRRPLEAISSFAVGALADTPKQRAFTALKHHIVVAALRSQGRNCSVCKKTNKQVELTVRFVTRHDDQLLQGFAPWNLDSICYLCAFKAPEEAEAAIA